MSIGYKLWLALSLLLAGTGAVALARRAASVPVWAPESEPVAMPQGQPAALPPTAIIEAGELLAGHGKELHSMRILVKNGRIEAVGPNVSAPGAVVYDLRSQTVMPGLIDVHVHLTRHFGPNGNATDPEETPMEFALGAANNLWVTLMAGFTTVQSVGAPPDATLRQYVQQGIIPGPDILTSYHDVFGSPKVGDDNVLRAKVDMLKYEGADLVKIFASNSERLGGQETLTLHQLQVLCGEANRQGLRTLVHAYRGSVHNATAAGCTEVEHGDWGTQDDLNVMARKGTYFDPQVGLVVQNYIRFQKQFTGSGSYDPKGFEIMKEGLHALDDKIFLEAMHTPGLRVVMGTDAVAGAFGHQEEEIIRRIKLGQPAMDAIDGATSLNAESLGLGKQLGSIAPGYMANIIAVTGNPLIDPTALREVSFVMKHGTVYKDTVSAAHQDSAHP